MTLCGRIVQGSSPCLEAVDTIILSHVPGRERGRAHGNELTFVLPMASVGRAGVGVVWCIGVVICIGIAAWSGSLLEMGRRGAWRNANALLGRKSTV